jgi:hypothetical protein
VNGDSHVRLLVGGLARPLSRALHRGASAPEAGTKHEGAVTPMPTMVLTAATEEAAHRDLPFPAEWFGLIALGIFAALFALTWSFRHVATKH